MTAACLLAVFLWLAPLPATTSVDAADPLAISPAMAQWARRAAGVGSAEQRLRRLHHALIAPTFGLREDPLSSTTAAEAFSGRRTNCVGFALLLAGLARSLGLPTFFVIFETPEPGGAKPSQNLRFQLAHLAVGFGSTARPLVLDLGGASHPEMGFRAVDARTARSVFFSNRGALALAHDDLKAAIGWLEKAVALDPALAAVWLNLGVAFRRVGDLDAAEKAYRRAAALDGDSLAVWRNLAQLLSARLAQGGPGCRREPELSSRSGGS